MSIVPGDSRTYGLGVIDPFMGTCRTSAYNDCLDFGTEWPHMCTGRGCRVLGYKRNGSHAPVPMQPWSRARAVGVIMPNDPHLPGYMGAQLRGMGAQPLGAVRPHAGSPFMFDMFGRPRLTAGRSFDRDSDEYQGTCLVRAVDLEKYVSHDVMGILLSYLPINEQAMFETMRDFRARVEAAEDAADWPREVVHEEVLWVEMCTDYAKDFLSDESRYMGNRSLRITMAYAGHSIDRIRGGAAINAIGSFEATSYAIEYVPCTVRRELYQVACCGAHGGNYLSVSCGTEEMNGRDFQVPAEGLAAEKSSVEYGSCMPPDFVHATLKAHRFASMEHHGWHERVQGPEAYSRDVTLIGCEAVSYQVAVIIDCGTEIQVVPLNYLDSLIGYTFASGVWAPPRRERSPRYHYGDRFYGVEDMLQNWAASSTPYSRDGEDPFFDVLDEGLVFKGPLMEHRVVRQHVDEQSPFRCSARPC